MSQIKLTQIEPAFASPMLLFQVEDCLALNRQLIEEAQTIRAGSPGLTRSNREGWHSEDDFFDRAEPGCAALRTHILGAVRETTQCLSPSFDFSAHRALCQGWINVNPPGAFNAPHDHSGFAISGVYYASMPPEGHSGAIEFLDPRSNANAHTIEGAACFNRKFVIHPKPGDLLVFPSYLTHWAQPNGGSADRITVAFNVRYLEQPAVKPEKFSSGDALKRTRPLAAMVSVLLASALLPAAAHAQAAPAASRPSAETVTQMQQELEALRGEQAQARAAEQERARRMDALARQIDAVARQAGVVLSPAAVPSELAAGPAISITKPGAATDAGTGSGGLEVAVSEDLKIRVFGRVTLDMIYNSSRPQAPGNPVFLVPEFAGGFSQHTMDINARNSQVGLAFSGPRIGSFQTGGRIAAVFFDNTNLFADRNGFLLTQAYGELFNDDWRFAAGLQLDLVAPGAPTVLPFAIEGAPIGNNIKGQLRLEHFVDLGGGSRLTLAAALAEPLTTNKTPDISLDEDNGLPNLEGRVALGVGEPEPVGIGLQKQRPLEVALSGMVGQLRRTSLPSEPPRRVVSDVWLAAVDFRVNLARLFGSGGDFGFQGEAYTGQGLGNYSGGVLQSLDAVSWEPIRTSGGWVEGFVYVTPSLHFHTGIFVDNPRDEDITPIPGSLFGRTYNQAIWGTLIWDVSRRFRVAMEATYRSTEYRDPSNLPNDGLGLHTQFQWTFGN